MDKLILWDVDGTLLNTGGLSGESMRAAMTSMFGPSPRRERTFYSGKTDSQIILDTYPDMTPAAVVEHLPTFAVTYVAEMHRRRDDLVARGRIFPGVLPALEALHGRVVQAPLTGNIAPAARLKLEWLGLLPYMHTDVGAYGDDHHERHRLVPIAAERASLHYGRSFGGRDIVIVGDTPHDIHCGKHNHTRTVAVATGPYSVEELATHQPDALLADLSDLDATLAAILG